MPLLYTAGSALSNSCAEKCKIFPSDGRLLPHCGRGKTLHRTQASKCPLNGAILAELFRKLQIARGVYGAALVLEKFFHRERFHTPYSTHHT